MAIVLRDRPESYGAVSKLLHWLIFALVVALFSLGLYFKDMPLGPEKLQLMALHKSIGFSVLVLLSLRLAWRAGNTKPALPEGMGPVERKLAVGAHRMLYLLLFIQPLSGLVSSWAANFPVSVFGLFTLPNLVEPDKQVMEAALVVHGISALFLGVIVVGHTGAALKHHFIDRDDVLRRMLPLAGPGNGHP